MPSQRCSHGGGGGGGGGRGGGGDGVGMTGGGGGIDGGDSQTDTRLVAPLKKSRVEKARSVKSLPAPHVTVKSLVGAPNAKVTARDFCDSSSIIGSYGLIAKAGQFLPGQTPGG